MKKNDNTVPNLDDNNVVISLDAFRKSKETAENMLKEHKTDDIERVLEKLEEKLKRIPKVGKHLANIPVYVSLIRSYIRKAFRYFGNTKRGPVMYILILLDLGRKVKR